MSLSRLVFKAGCGCGKRFYRFLIITILSTSGESDNNNNWKNATAVPMLEYRECLRNNMLLQNLLDNEINSETDTNNAFLLLLKSRKLLLNA